MLSQFIRLEAYNCTRATANLAEAAREPEFCKHVRQVSEPWWLTGSQQEVSFAIEAYMAKPVPIRYPNGKVDMRKQRRDHRCLVAGVASWPGSVEDVRQGSIEQRKLLSEWLQRTRDWLHEQFGKNLIAVVVHLDESHPHLHFFVVGDANKTHPGLRARYTDGIRLECKKEKDRRYRKAMKQFLDDHHREVSSRFDIARKTQVGSTCRITNRGLAYRINKLEKRLVEAGDEQGLERLSEIVRDAPKTPRESMRF
jgi:Plasmid recombination enzyme